MNIDTVKTYLLNLQNTVCTELSNLETEKTFILDEWQHQHGGGGRSRVLEEGDVIEKGGVNFSHVQGQALPAAATQRRPELVGRSFEAMGVSLVIHPQNPLAPTSHMNVRFFVARKQDEADVWWFGGGYDLTPYYAFIEDCQHWHDTAKQACQLVGDKAYAQYKKACDEYFYLKHRQEPRGIGGLFFDDLNQGSFEACFAFMQAVGDSYLTAYLPILQRRHIMPYTELQKRFQKFRRGRYVEFNLVYDRGTLFGLQTGGRTQSILMSLPPQVEWHYQLAEEFADDQQKLLTVFEQMRNQP